MAIYTNVEEIPYPFLHDACFLMDKYTEGFSKVRVTKEGECCITLNGILDDDKLKRVLMELDHNVTSESTLDDYTPLMYENYDYSYDNKQTYIYTPEGVDYRNF